MKLLYCDLSLMKIDKFFYMFGYWLFVFFIWVNIIIKMIEVFYLVVFVNKVYLIGN